MKRLLVTSVCGALALSATAAFGSGGYISGEMSNPPRAVFSAPAPVAAPVYANPCPPANPCAPATTTYMPVAAPAACSSCAPVAAFSPVVAAPAPCTSCAPVTTFSPVVAAPAPCTSCAPVTTFSPVVTYSPVVAFSPVMRPAPIVGPGAAPVVVTPVFGRRAILRTPVVVPAYRPVWP
jgi:hypothetical protein